MSDFDRLEDLVDVTEGLMDDGVTGLAVGDVLWAIREIEQLRTSQRKALAALDGTPRLSDVIRARAALRTAAPTEEPRRKRGRPSDAALRGDL